MKNAHKLSIVIPVYNRQDSLDLLLLCLSNSIVAGNFKNEIEVIVIDDHSPIAITVLDYPFSIILTRNSENKGAPRSREIGFTLSNGHFVHFHDSDDSFSDYWLNEIMNELQLHPKLDVLMTGRIDIDAQNKTVKSQKYFHKQVQHPENIKSRLIYRNCMGPLGGVIFSREILLKITFKSFLSCQDWQMYIDTIEHAKLLRSRPDIHFIFDKTGDDRISHNPRKKLLGHSQLAKITYQYSPFKKYIRLFYLYTCKEHIYNKGGSILNFYKKNRFKIIGIFLLVSLYWRLT